ncbi:hypothetical protein [Bradyrhizobium sp. WD16]|uniref:hypothetical protein n=1 Tax=Bradyrhizobium sp. WD16 TaxID=1521768 RepID=UPI0020A5E143|nr:hypothetical protein [Bradyrhizobium sp. WD16]
MGRTILAGAGMLMLVGCAGMGGGDEATSYMTDSSLAVQPFPANYRADLLAFMRTYLNNPRGIRNAVIAEPVQRNIGGRTRYVACLRYTATDEGDRYDGSEDRAALFLDGRLDRLIPRAKELCGSVAYMPFPELEKLTR